MSSNLPIRKSKKGFRIYQTSQALNGKVNIDICYQIYYYIVFGFLKVERAEKKLDQARAPCLVFNDKVEKHPYIASFFVTNSEMQSTASHFV